MVYGSTFYIVYGEIGMVIEDDERKNDFIMETFNEIREKLVKIFPRQNGDLMDMNITHSLESLFDITESIDAKIK